MSKKTVLVTGATGYIAKHIVLQLLNDGHSVVGSTRSIKREAELRDALTPHLTDPTSQLGRLHVVELELTDDKGWAEAMHGVDLLMHIASPLPVKWPSNEEEVIRPAVDGAMRAVKAAREAGIKRVIMTSSVAAIANRELPDGRTAYDESDWSDISSPSINSYVKSKTLAERAVWDWNKTEAPEMQITMINPAFVMGAPLGKKYGRSVKLIEQMLKGEFWIVPKYGYSCVDVQDIALMHLRAMYHPDETAGKRFIGNDRFLWYSEMAQILKETYPDRSNITTRETSNWQIWIMSLYDPSLKHKLKDLGRRRECSNVQSCEILGMTFCDVRDSLPETAAYLIHNDLV